MEIYKPEIFNSTNNAASESKNLSSNIWQDMRETRSEATLAQPTALSIRDGAKPASTTDLTIGTGVQTAPKDALPTIEIYDSNALVKDAPKDLPAEQSVKANVSQETGKPNLNWDTQSEELVGKPNQP